MNALKPAEPVVHPAPTVLGYPDIFQQDIDLSEILMNDVPPAAALTDTRPSPVYSWLVEQVNYSGEVVMMTSQDVTVPADTALTGGTKILCPMRTQDLTCPPTMILGM